MRRVYSIADNIVSPLGLESKDNWDNIVKGISGVSSNNALSIHSESFFASLLNEEVVTDALKEHTNANGYTKLEKMFILSILNATKQCDIDLTSSRTLFVFATTKGNIDLLGKAASDSYPSARISLAAMAKHVTGFFGNPNNPVVMSNACTSGVLALITSGYYIKENIYDKVVVTGGDILSEFTFSGFQCLQALSRGICKPFDKNRDGINLGEACATIVLSSKATPAGIELKAGATSNDANHISGPSRTGEGLLRAINNVLSYSHSSHSDIGYISAHGTATPYNDEMEAKAFHSARIAQAPVNSLKGYFGHTLGAAGILETIMAIWSMKKELIIASKGYDENGVSAPLQIVKENIVKKINKCLKTASGFGGCNAALLFEKND